MGPIKPVKNSVIVLIFIMINIINNDSDNGSLCPLERPWMVLNVRTASQLKSFIGQLSCTLHSSYTLQSPLLSILLFKCQATTKAF